MFYKYMKIVLAPNTVAHIKNNFYNADIGEETRETQVSVEGLPVLHIPAGLGGFVDVVLAHIESVDKFFCQLQNQADVIEKLSAELNTYYSNDSAVKPYINPTNGTMCVAKYSLDNCWYRGFVLERPTPALVEIYFVDYGNTERVQKTDLRVITKEFEQYPPQAFQCKLKGVSANAQNVSKFKECAEGCKLTIKLDGKLDKTFEVILFDTNPTSKQECNINDFVNGRSDVQPSKLMAPKQVQGHQPQAGPMTNGFGGGGGSDDGFQRKSDYGNRGGRSDRGGFSGGGRYDGEGGGFRGGRGGRGRGGFGGNENGGESGGGGFGSNGFNDGGSDDRRGGYRGGRGGDRGGRGGGRGRFGDREGGGRFGDRGGRGGGRRDGGFGEGGGGGFRNESGGFGGGGGFSNNAGGGFQSNGPASSGFESTPAPTNDFASSAPSAPVVEQKVETVEHSITASAAPTTVETTVVENKEPERCIPTQPEESEAVELSSSEAELPTPAAASVKYVRFHPLKIPDDNVADVYLSVAVSPDEVYAQLVSEADQLLSSTDRLQKYCNDPSTSKKLPRDNIFLGMACAAKYADDSFYRCVPTEINLDYDTASVYFVDFGNSQTVPLTELYELSDDFIAQSCYAVRCRLDRLAPPEDSTSYGEEAQQDIDLLAVNEEGVPKKFECRFACRFEPCLVELQCEGERLDDQLTRLSHCRKAERGRYFDGPYKKLDPAKLTRTVAVVSYAETPSSMYIYPSHHQPEQDGLMVQLPAEYDDPSSDIDSLSKADAVVGTVCAAKYSVDEAWYRSEIVELGNDDDATCTVRFVDYGNTENCKLADLKKLLFCYGALPALALNVKMDGVIAQETPTALEKFAEIVHQMDTDYAIEFVDLKSPTPVAPFLVKLFVPGETICVNDQLNAAISTLCESVVFDEKKVAAEILTENGGVVNSSPEPEPAALAACITEKLLNYVDSQTKDDSQIDSPEQKSESVVIDEQQPESELVEGEQEIENSSVDAEQVAAALDSAIAADDSTKVEAEN